MSISTRPQPEIPSSAFRCAHPRRVVHDAMYVKKSPSPRVVRCANQHVFDSWVTIAQVPYHRHDAGPPVRVALPNKRRPCVLFERHHLLHTKALDKVRRMYHHCAHFYLKGVCDLGDQCTFIHAAFLEPTSVSIARQPQVEAAADSCSRPTGSSTSSLLPSPPPRDSASPRWWYRDPYTATRVYINGCCSRSGKLIASSLCFEL
jgi:hypothetical protein